MNKPQLNQLEKMLTLDNVKGKKLIEQVIWLNTVKPKYKKDDYVKFNDYARTILGQQVCGFNGKIIEISFYPRERTICYKIEFTTTNKEKTYTTETYVNEYNITGKSKTDINKVTTSSEHNDLIRF